MTSDAKIGLLLGLIFIFVIAFIINGLPNLRPQSSKAEMTTDLASTHNDDLGIAGKEQKVQDEISWRDLIDNQTGEPSGPVATTQNAQPMASNPERTMAAGNATEGARSLLPSAEGIERLTRGLQDVVKIVVEASETGAARKTTEPAPSVEVAKSQPKPEPARVEQPQTTPTTKPAVSAPAGGKTYLVVDGDNLATIAKKVYGLEEGNRIINNQRIFEANRNVLKSPDDIHIGQELVIPPAAKPDTVLPKTLFEKVEAIGKRRVPAPESTEPAKPAAAKTEAPKPAAPKTEPAKPAAGERWYVVQDGDNLWRIAASQLGSGLRHEEITKLNADILKGDIKVSPGMRLRLPAK